PFKKRSSSHGLPRISAATSSKPSSMLRSIPRRRASWYAGSNRPNTLPSAIATPPIRACWRWRIVYRRRMVRIEHRKQARIRGRFRLCRGPGSNWRHMVLQTIALPTELPRPVFIGFRENATLQNELLLTPSRLKPVSNRRDHGSTYTMALLILLSPDVFRKRRRVARELGRAEPTVIATEHVHAPPVSHLHDRGLRNPRLERIARPGVAVAVRLVPRDAVLEEPLAKALVHRVPATL